MKSLLYDYGSYKNWIVIYSRDIDFQINLSDFRLESYKTDMIDSDLKHTIHISIQISNYFNYKLI